MARRVTTIYFAAVLPWLITACGPAREAANDAELASRWLSATEPAPEELLRQIGDRWAALEPVFIQAFNEGPSENRKARVLAAVERGWALMQIQLAEPEVYGLTAAEIAEMKAISLVDEKSEALALLDYNYRASALAGLAFTRGPAGRELLARTAAASGSPFRAVAELALKRIAANPR